MLQNKHLLGINLKVKYYPKQKSDDKKSKMTIFLNISYLQIHKITDL